MMSEWSVHATRSNLTVESLALHEGQSCRSRLLQEHADELASLRAAHPRTDVGHALCCDLFQCVSGTSGHSWQDIGQDLSMTDTTHMHSD